MKRLRANPKHAISIASFTSLLLCGMFALAWIRGHFASDFLDYSRGELSFTVAIIDRSAFVIASRSRPPSHQGWAYSPNPPDPGYTARYYPTIWGTLGFYLERNESRDATSFARTAVVGLPFWVLCLLTGIAPGAFVIKRQRERTRLARRTLGLCPQCGYDLRASLGRCPECGRVTMPA